MVRFSLRHACLQRLSAGAIPPDRSTGGTRAERVRIGIDGREVLGQPTGVGRYLASLCAEWTASAAHAGHELLVYTPRPAPAGAFTAAAAPAGARLHAVTVPGSGGFRWEQTALARQADADGLDVFFGPGYSLPLALRVPSVVTMHDVSFFAHPEWFGWREGPRRRWLARRAAAAARAVIAVSEFSRRETIRYLDTDPDRVRVVHNGVHPVADRVDAERVRTERTDAGRPLVLYVGTLLARRRLPVLLAAFARVLRDIPEAELAVVGADRSRPREDLRGIAEALGVASRVALLSYVDEAALAALYRRATIFVWLSEYEGFGLPPLEALAAGVPAVVGDTAAAREVCGRAVRRVPVDDPAAVAAAIVEVVTRQDVRDALLAAAGPVLAHCTWARAAAGTFAVLEDAAAARR